MSGVSDHGRREGDELFDRRGEFAHRHRPLLKSKEGWLVLAAGSVTMRATAFPRKRAGLGKLVPAPSTFHANIKIDFLFHFFSAR